MLCWAALGTDQPYSEEQAQKTKKGEHGRRYESLTLVAGAAVHGVELEGKQSGLLRVSPPHLLEHLLRRGLERDQPADQLIAFEARRHRRKQPFLLDSNQEAL